MLAAWICCGGVQAATAPDWMHARLGTALPLHEAKTVAVVLYDETVLTVQPTGRMTKLERRVLRILRPDGEPRGTIRTEFDAQSRITRFRAWSIPAVGKDYELKDKDAEESSVGVDGGELITDERVKTMRIPEAMPGSVIGYEIEQEVRPYLMVDEWDFQDTIPVVESRFTLSLPPGWSYRATWLNHAEQPPVETAPGQFTWTVHPLDPIRLEAHMPPWLGIAGRLQVAVVAPNAPEPGIRDWRDLGAWYGNLTQGRREPSADIRRKVAELTTGQSTPLERMASIARFVQSDVRYVAIELGMGGFQPHAAAEIFGHRYGDCKDKVTLMSTMLKEIGVDSYYVFINTVRGAVTPTTPPNLRFDHAILAIALPPGIDSGSLEARQTLGGQTLLFFDPTDYLTPFGQLRGPLQANYGLVIAPSGAQLVKLPQIPGTANGVTRTAKLTLDEDGTLRGDVHESRMGDSASEQRWALRATEHETDRIKPMETMLGESLSSYQIVKASIRNLHTPAQPFEWNYTVEAANYAKPAGDIVLVRPRVLGSVSTGFLESKEPRRNDIEFTGPERDTDVFEITLPTGYDVEELPEPVSVDDGFATYQSKSELVGRILRYSRAFEIKELSVPAAKAEEARQFFRIIESDERNAVVLKPAR